MTPTHVLVWAVLLISSCSLQRFAAAEVDACRARSSLETLLNLVTTQVNAQTLQDRSSPVKLKYQAHYDFIVVGGGTAGCVIASRLSEINDWNVLLIEAGGEEPHMKDVPAFYCYPTNTRIDWAFKTQPSSAYCGGQPCAWSSGKGLGGGSAVNVLMYHRGNRRDYDHWESLGNTGWGYKDVLYFYKKSEDQQDPEFAKDTEYHSTGGPQAVSNFPYIDVSAQALYEAYLELGNPKIDINGAHSAGTMYLQGTLKDGVRMSTNKAFIEPIRHKRSNLHIVTNARVTRVLIHPENNTVYGIEYALENDKFSTGRVYASKEVVISAGAINSPQILMLSGIGLRSTLEPLKIPVLKELSVGQNLMQHVGALAVHYKTGDVGIPTNEQVWNDALMWSAERKGPWSSISAALPTLSFKSRYIDPNDDYPDIQFYIQPAPLPGCISDYNVPLCYYKGLDIIPNMYRATSRGNVTINTTDPFAMPLIHPNYFDTQHDKDCVIDGSNYAMKLNDTKAFRDRGYVVDATPIEPCKQYPFASDDYWLCNARYNTGMMFHPSGTCKMGPAGDPTAVVDPRLKVHGINGLRVADTSILPYITSGNIAAPAMMIGEKVSDMIKQDYYKL